MQIIIIDDHPVVLNGTKAILDPHYDVLTVDGSVNAKEKLEHILSTHTIALCLIDVQMPGVNGLQICEFVRQKWPNIKLILYTGFDAKDYVQYMIEQRIDGIISKTASKEQLLNAIEGVLIGNVLLPTDVFSQIIRTMSANNELQKEVQLLNSKEIQIIQQVAEGQTNKAIAIELQLSQRTIENYLTKIFDKLQVSSRAEAVLKANELNILK